ncbi:MAG: RIP metalloprotease RseP [Eubacteriales bacterium]
MSAIIAAIIMFCILVLFHEGGHFFMAKAVGIKVNEFAIGMGPILFKKQKGETLYSVRAFPIGGFCAMESSECEDEILPRSFEAAKISHRAFVLLAGPLMNFLVAILIMIGIALYVGTPSQTVGQFADVSPAREAGLATGDKIVSIQGETVKNWSDVGTIIGSSAKEKVSIEVERNGNIKTFDVALTTDEKTGRKLIGIMPKMMHNPANAVILGVKSSYEITASMLDAIGKLFTKEVSPKELTGVVGITVAVGNTMNYGFIYLAQFAALISINLGIVNLFPFPALDGGRLVFLAIRRVTGKAITDDMEAKVHFAGIVCLFALMIYVTWQDIGRFILK